jgi:hypothetical protein
MNTKKTNVVKASTAEEIEKAIAEHERQIEAYRQELIEVKKRTALAKSEKNIFVYIDSVRKNPPDKLKTIIEVGCLNYKTNLATLRSNFRKDQDDLQHRCVNECLDAYRKQVGESAVTPENFLKLLEDVCPDVKIEIEKAEAEKAKVEAEAKKAKAEAEAEKAKNKTNESPKKDGDENKAAKNINVPPSTVI